jgi:hypothetical protein
MSYPEDTRTDSTVEHEVAEHVRKEDEEIRTNGNKKLLKKRKKQDEEIEAEDDLREEAPAPGYPDHTALPFPLGED